MDYMPRRARIWEWLGIGVPLGSLFGIKIRAHLLLLLVLLYNWVPYANSNIPTNWKIGLWMFSFIAMFGSVLLHELGHCYGSYRVGGHAEQIILWPLGGLAYASGMEKGPKEELIVTILGPAVSLGLAVIFTAGYYGVGAVMEPPPFWLEMGLRHLAFLNWILFAFNMLLPLFPMDSARIIRGFSSMRFNPNIVTYRLTTFGMWFGGIMAVLAFFRAFNELIGPWLGLIGLFGAIACYQERKRLEYSDVYMDGPWYWRNSQYASETSPQSRSVLAEVRDAFSTLGSSASSRSHSHPMEPPTERERLRKELEEATLHEDFERAARLRDQIRNLPRGPKSD